MSGCEITCEECGATFNCARKLSPVQRRRRLAYLLRVHECRAEQHAKNWTLACTKCGERPTIGTTGLCGPCCFVEVDA